MLFVEKQTILACLHAGNALIVVYGPAEVKFTLEQLRLQWTTTSMILFIIALGLLLGALHWGKEKVSRLRLEAQTASVRERWRAKAKNDPQLLVFAHALLFSTYAGLIGGLPWPHVHYIFCGQGRSATVVFEAL